jgi:hypothetical protein
MICCNPHFISFFTFIDFSLYICNAHVSYTHIIARIATLAIIRTYDTYVITFYTLRINKFSISILTTHL